MVLEMDDNRFRAIPPDAAPLCGRCGLRPASFRVPWQSDPITRLAADEAEAESPWEGLCTSCVGAIFFGAAAGDVDDLLIEVARLEAARRLIDSSYAPGDDLSDSDTAG